VASRLPSETFVRPVASKSVVDEVTEEIARSIRSGSLRPGQEFSLREIAGQLGVSFIPVREALRRLEGQGLLVTRRNRSAIVAPLDADDLHAIYRLRRQIEPDLAAAACRTLADADYAQLETFLDMFADESLGIDDIYDAHHFFHIELLRPAASSWDLRILETLWRAAERYVRFAFGRLDPDPAEHRRRAAVHADIIDSFRSRDARAVRRAVLHHLAENEEIAMEAIAHTQQGET
jgi:DNA-binding GntR family transcriptional regulator